MFLYQRKEERKKYIRKIKIKRKEKKKARKVRKNIVKKKEKKDKRQTYIGERKKGIY